METGDFWKWLGRISNLWGLGGGLVSGIGAYLGGLHWSVIFTLALGAAAFCTWLLNGLKARAREKTAHIPQSCNFDSHIEFYQDRRNIFSILGRLETAREVYALLNTGAKAKDDIFNRTKVSKLIVIDPEPPEGQNRSKNIDMVWEHTQTRRRLEKKDLLFVDQEVKDMRGNIRYITREAMSRKIEVRWHNIVMTDTFIIADPTSGDGWIYCSLFGPFMRPDDRPGLIIERNKQPDLFERLLKLYDAIWNNAVRKPKLEESIE